MSDCSVCLYYDGDYAEVFNSKNVRARKEYSCSECERPIPKGETHQVATMLCDGAWETFRTCLVCAEIRKAFCCEGEFFGGMFWEEMQDYGFPSIAKSGDCLKRLSSPEAKRYFAQRYREWQEAQRD